jgi:hypothetical protein
MQSFFQGVHEKQAEMGLPSELRKSIAQCPMHFRIFVWWCLHPGGAALTYQHSVPTIKLPKG